MAYLVDFLVAIADQLMALFNLIFLPLVELMPSINLHLDVLKEALCYAQYFLDVNYALKCLVTLIQMYITLFIFSKFRSIIPFIGK